MKIPVNQLSFKKVVDGSVEFDHVNRYMNNQVSQLYGNQNKSIQKIAEGEDRNCELLVGRNTEEYGVLVYKNQLSSQIKEMPFSDIFVIKSLFVINPLENSGKGIATGLLHRSSQIACHLNAKRLFVSVSSRAPESIGFFLSYGFRIEAVYQDLYLKGLNEYFLLHHEPEKLLFDTTHSLSHPKNRQIHLSLKKRDFGERELITKEGMVVDYFAGNEMAQEFFDGYFGIFPTAGLIQHTMKKFVRLTLSWQKRQTVKHYPVVFVDPLYKDPEKDHFLGDVVIGITMFGDRHLLAFCPSRFFPMMYWSQVFQELMAGGIERIDILCCPHPAAFDGLQEFFPHTKIERATCPKSWFPENFSPLYVLEEMINTCTSAGTLFDRTMK